MNTFADPPSPAEIESIPQPEGDVSALGMANLPDVPELQQLMDGFLLVTNIPMSRIEEIF